MIYRLLDSLTISTRMSVIMEIENRMPIPMTLRLTARYAIFQPLLYALFISNYSSLVPTVPSTLEMCWLVAGIPLLTYLASLETQLCTYRIIQLAKENDLQPDGSHRGRPIITPSLPIFPFLSVALLIAIPLYGWWEIAPSAILFSALILTLHATDYIVAGIVDTHCRAILREATYKNGSLVF